MENAVIYILHFHVVSICDILAIYHVLSPYHNTMDLEQSCDTFHSHSPWRKAILIPIWAFETIVLAVNVVVMGLLISVTKAGSANNDGGLQPYDSLPLLLPRDGGSY